MLQLDLICGKRPEVNNTIPTLASSVSAGFLLTLKLLGKISNFLLRIVHLVNLQYRTRTQYTEWLVIEQVHRLCAESPALRQTLIFMHRDPLRAGVCAADTCSSNPGPPGNAKKKSLSYFDMVYYNDEALKMTTCKHVLVNMWKCSHFLYILLTLKLHIIWSCHHVPGSAFVSLRHCNKHVNI